MVWHDSRWLPHLADLGYITHGSRCPAGSWERTAQSQVHQLQQPAAFTRLPASFWRPHAMGLAPAPSPRGWAGHPQKATSSHFPMGLRNHRRSKIPCLEVSRVGLHPLVFYTNSFWHHHSIALAVLIWRGGGKTNTKTWAVHIPRIGSEEERNKYTLWKNPQENKYWHKQLVAHGCFKETGASDTLLHWTGVLLCSLHHLKCPHYNSLPRTTFLLFYQLQSLQDLYFISFHLLLRTAQNCPEAASEAPQPPAAPTVGAVYSPAHYG